MFYSVNGETKEHIANRVRRGDGWYTIHTDEDGWIRRLCKTKDDCPVPYGTLVDVEHRDGVRFYNQKAGFSQDWSIGDRQNDDDIVAYRPSSAANLTSESEGPWDGDLPPVGTICKMIGSDELTVKIQAYGKHGREDAVLVCEHEGGLDCQMHGVLCKHVTFKPVEDEEDVAVKEMMDVLGKGSGAVGTANICRSLYNAGYRKVEV